MAFLTSFMTGGLQRQLDRWGEEDASIAAKIEKIGEALVKADDNANQKVEKLQNVAGILNSKYGKNGIYQLAFNVDNNSIDFNQDVNDIAKLVSGYELPENYLQEIADPYSYLGQATQSMYEKDTSAYNNLYSALNTGNKTVDLLVPKRNYGDYFTGLSEAPTIGAEPITSAYPGVTKSDLQNNAYGKLAFLVQNKIPLADAMNPKYGKFALDELEMGFIKNEVKDAESAQDIYNNILIHAAEEFAGTKFLTDTKPEDIVAGINQILDLGNFNKAYTPTDTSISQGDVNVNSFLNQSNVYSSSDSLSNYQKNLPRVSVDFDALSDAEANEILSNITEGTIIEFKTGGQTYFVEF